MPLLILWRVFMDSKTLDLSGITDEQLLVLLKDIEKHIDFLNKSIIEEEVDSNKNE